MSDNVKCFICERNFKDKFGLEQHNSAVHSSNDIRRANKWNLMKYKYWGILIIVFLIIAVGVYWSINAGVKDISSCKNDPVTSINIGGHENIALHIHSMLRVVVDGVEQQIPANVGVSPGIMRPLHTHDATGEIHIEGPCARDFKVGEFFDVWGKQLNGSCVLENCGGVVKLIVDGNEISENRNYIMKDGDNILIEYVNQNGL